MACGVVGRFSDFSVLHDQYFCLKTCLGESKFLAKMLDYQ